MSEMAEYSPVKKSGCGAMLLGGFKCRSFWPRRSQSANELPSQNNKNITKQPSAHSKRRRGGSDETAFLDTYTLSDPPSKLPDKPLVKAAPHHPKPYQNHHNREPSDGAIVPANTSKALITKVVPTTQQGNGQGRRVPKEAIGISGELDSMIADHQRSKGSNNLVRASSSNVFLFGHLGNIRQPGGTNQNSSNQQQPSSTSTANNVLEYLPKTGRENGSGGRRSNAGVMGNIVRRSSFDDSQEQQQQQQQQGSFCRALSKRLDPEELKVMGNEEYKKGRFAEALSLYDRAILLDPNKAAYRSNKSAALTGMGRLLEAIFECREAIRIDPSYQRAHHRLATLFLRLGEAEKALNHYKQSGPEASSNDYAKVQAVQTHVNRCNEARRIKDWQTLLKESRTAISSGADSALQVLAMQAEALLKLQRHDDADTTLTTWPAFDMDACTKFFGPTTYSFILQIQAQVDMAAGRFEDAVVAAQRACRLDSSNREVSAMVRKARAVSLARNRGNDHFKASKFLEACVAYGEGLEHDPLNSVLLCNRAACRSKLDQFEKAVEDCTHALNLRPSYSKARLRRADSYAKLERWEAAIQDYEMLIRKTPGDVEVGRALFEAQLQLKKRRGEDVQGLKFGADIIVITSNERFRHFVTSPGMSVVLFCNKSSEKQQILQTLEHLCKRYPSVNFLKVDVEEHRFLAKSEGVGVSAVPTVKIYKNGSRVKDIPGNNLELLESSVKYFTS
ncbi:inactive TPR repeat-containing thioredoxin TTL3-like [Telopea speciosissima]|uniref:inactive TPR repeat-containing thioredoxin TTL3-like n=1 Tax=Telopea speciosissima TaxID=54955 RepID=UPI001CC53D81|nr:inactive TPR repeat-containing thioredoxin TTL3-like [Telopea speciosissima]